MGQESASNVGDTGDTGWIPGEGRFSGGGKWQPTPVFLPENSHGQRSLAGYSPWGCKESDTTKVYGIRYGCFSSSYNLF